jgi:outer membrane protein TolC
MLILIALILSQGGFAEAEPLTESLAVEQALAQNPTLRAAVLDLRAAQEALRAAESVHRPSMQIGIDGGHRETLSATMSGVAPNDDDSVGLDVGLSYASKVGTELSVDVGGSWSSREVNRDPSTTTNISIGSIYGVDASVGVTQPLLRGAGRDVGEADIRSAGLSKTAAEHARDAAASELVRDVLSSYWELWYAQEAVEVNRAARELAEQQLADAETRVRALGTLAPTESLRFASELASIEEQLVQAEADRRSRSVELGRLIGRGSRSTPSIAVGSTAPNAVGEELSLPTVEEVVATTRGASSELRELVAELEVSRDRARVAQDATLPRLDLTASFAVGGVWTEETISEGGLPNDRPALSGQLGLELELPLGNARARAELAEARLQAAALEARLEARERQIASEAVTVLDALRSARRRVELAERSVEIARQLAEAEQEALRLGTSTALEVLEAQASQRETELRYLRALVDQTTAETALEHLTGRLLEHYATQGVTP